MTSFTGQIRLRRWAVDEIRRRLTELGNLHAQLLADLEALDEESRAEASAAATLEYRATYPAFALRQRARRDRLVQSIDDVAARVESARDELTDAFAELKKIELAAAAAAARERLRRERRDQELANEVALEGFRRRRQ